MAKKAESANKNGKDSSDKSSKKTEEKPVEKTLEELILNFSVGKYTAIPMASIWAKELRRRDEFRHLTSTEILEMALRQVLEGTVGWKELKKVVAANGSAGARIFDGKEKTGKK